jgi:hypothetical protein
MNIGGVVHNGVVVLDSDRALPEGARVTVSYFEPTEPSNVKRRVKLPMVHSDQPGALDLTNQRIAEILDEEDVSS